MEAGGRMTQIREIVRKVIVCDECGTDYEITSEFDDDKVEGYYLNQVERVTEARRHYRTSEPLFFCTKDCLIRYFQFGISHSTNPWRPIGRRFMGVGNSPSAMT